MIRSSVSQLIEYQESCITDLTVSLFASPSFLICDRKSQKRNKIGRISVYIDMSEWMYNMSFFISFLYEKLYNDDEGNGNDNDNNNIRIKQQIAHNKKMIGQFM